MLPSYRRRTPAIDEGRVFGGGPVFGNAFLAVAGNKIDLAGLDIDSDAAVFEIVM